MNRWMVMALCGAMAIGCGASNEGGVNPPVDSGVSGGSDTGTSGMTDTGTTTDRGTATTDRGTATDRGTDSGTASQFGTCGMTTRTALCTCGNNATCQQNALNMAFMRSPACQSCYQNGITSCCPDQVAAAQQCAQDNGCMDQACLQAMCRTQLTAVESCLMTAQQSNPTCQMAFQRCFGADFPMITCE